MVYLGKAEQQAGAETGKQAAPPQKNAPAKTAKRAPLPPPIPVADVHPAQPQNVIPFSAGSAPSLTPICDPRPGDPLTNEQEHILADVPQFIGDAPAASRGAQGDADGRARVAML